MLIGAECSYLTEQQNKKRRRRIAGGQESADERMEARVLIRAECSWLTEEENEVAGREFRSQENVIKKEMRRASGGGI